MNRAKIFFISQFLVIWILWTVFYFVWMPNFNSESSVNDRILKNQNEELSFTWSVISEINQDDWKFLVKNEFGKEFITISKDLDLNNFIWDKKIFLEWEKIFNNKWKIFFDVKKISRIEEKNIKEPKKYFLENKFWWYWFEVDENIFTAVKWWSKTFLKNWSWEVILKFFSFDFKNTNLIKWSFFSDWWQEYEMQTKNWIIYWEVKNLKNWQEIFLKNKKSENFKENYWVLIQIDYWEIWEEYFNRNWKKVEEWKKDEIKLETLKREIAWFLKTFYFVEKENISKEKCWWKENILCEEWYFCELFSTSENASGRCVKL